MVLDELAACRKIENVGLQEVLTSVLLDESTCSAPMSQSEVCSIFERYAMTHFHGKLLPGCCCMGCTDLQEVSEALKTLLCSGCRGARYWCLSTAAWSARGLCGWKGGHSGECGKQKGCI